MPPASDSNPLILPIGTAVVRTTAGVAEVRSSDQGAVGVVVGVPVDPEHSYRVRFPGGEELSLRRYELSVLKHYQEQGMTRDGTHADDLFQHVIYRCVIGSRAYGLEHDESDTDRRGIYLPPAALHWSLAGVPEQIENNDTEECYWEIEKFLRLALKANPNVLEVLYSPLVEDVTGVAEEILARREIFLSRLVYQTYNGYVMSQFKKLGQDIRNRGRIKWKHAMHLIRLLLSGITTLREGYVPVRVAEHRELLLTIRDGEMAWEDIDKWRLELHREFDGAYAETKLPERPDYESANDILVRARKSMTVL